MDENQKHYRVAVHRRRDDDVWECACGRWWPIRPSNIRSMGAKARAHMKDVAPAGTVPPWGNRDEAKPNAVPGERAEANILHDLLRF